MKKNLRVIRRGPLKSKKIELAPTAGIEGFVDFYEEFIERIFGFEPGDYLITDESSLSDFVGLEKEITKSDLHQTIWQMYGVDVSDLKNGNLLEIFKRIQASKKGVAK